MNELAEMLIDSIEDGDLTTHLSTYRIGNATYVCVGKETYLWHSGVQRWDRGRETVSRNEVFLAIRLHLEGVEVELPKETWEILADSPWEYIETEDPNAEPTEVFHWEGPGWYAPIERSDGVHWWAVDINNPLDLAGYGTPSFFGVPCYE